MPVFSAAGAAVAGAIFGSGAASAIAIGATIGQFAGGLALNALATELFQPSAAAPPASIKKTADIGVVPRSIILGRTATPGSEFFEQTTGLDSGEEKRFYVVGHVLSDVPIRGLVEIWINDLRCTIGGTYVAGRGYPIIPPPYYNETMEAWVTCHDGTQTTADPVLLAASEPGYEWDETGILRGCAYAVCVFRAKRSVFPAFPQPLYVVDGAPLADAETGQTGTGDDLVAVQVHNLLTGIRYGDELIYGPQVPGVLHNAASEVAKCRTPVPGAENWSAQKKMAAFGSQTVPAQYRSGMEIPVNMPIADALREIMAAANAKIAFTGSGYRLACGAPGAPVRSVSSDDILLDRPQSFSPFLPLAEAVNSVITIYPEPKKKWADRELKPLIVPSYEAEDGDRRLTATIQLRAVSHGEQGQRVRKLALDEARRAARVTKTFPPEFSDLEPLDVIALTDPRTGSLDKAYRIDGRDLERSGKVTLDLTEVDSSWSYEEGDFDPSEPAPVTQQPVGTYELLGFTAEPYAIRDNSGVARRPAIRMSWLADQTGRHVAYHIVAAETGTEVAKTTAALQDGETVTAAGISPGETYRVRGRKVIGRGKTPWSDWITVTVGDIRLGIEDVDVDLGEEDIDAPVMNDPTTRLAADGTARVTFSWSQIGNAVNYDLLVSEDGGGEVSLPTTKRVHEIKATAGLLYTGRVRAQGRFGTPSVYTETVSIVAAADSEPPAVPTGLAAQSGFEAIWLTWSKVDAPDLAYYEVVEKVGSSAPAVNTTATVYRSLSTTFARTGVPEGFTRYYWVRAVDTSGNRSAWSVDGVQGQSINIDFSQLTGLVTAAQVVSSNLITLSAQIKDAIITDAKISALSAAKLTAGTALTSTLTVNGTALSTIRERSDDPAARINQANTQLDPGKVVISGGTTLADWRMGGDETRMDGGYLSANTVAANSMVIGSRNVALNGIEFEHNSPTPDRVSWTAGFIRYINDAGNAATVGIPANDVAWTSGVLYIYWVKDQSLLRITTDSATAFGKDRMVLATYQGGRNLDANFGRVVIDGNGGIKARSIRANNLAVEELITDEAQIRELTVDTIHVKDGAITSFETANGGEVRNSTDTWATLCSMVLPALPGKSSVAGSFQAVLTANPANYPNDFALQLLIDGQLSILINKNTLNANGSSWFLNFPIAKKTLAGSTVQVVARVRRTGIYGIQTSNMYGMVRKK